MSFFYKVFELFTKKYFFHARKNFQLNSIFQSFVFSEVFDVYRVKLGRALQNTVHLGFIYLFSVGGLAVFSVKDLGSQQNF